MPLPLIRPIGYWVEQLPNLKLFRLLAWSGKEQRQGGDRLFYQKWRILGTADATRWQRAIADSQLIWIEDAGHVPHFDQPQVVANHLLSFMQHVEH